VCVHTARPCAREQRKQQEVAFRCADEIEGAGIARKCELLIKISYLCCFPLLSARKERVDCFFPAPELSGSVVINMLDQGSAPCCSEVIDNSFGGDRYFLEPCARSTRRCSRILSTARGSFPPCIANLLPGVGRMHQKAAADRIPGPRGPESGVLQPVSGVGQRSGARSSCSRFPCRACADTSAAASSCVECEPASRGSGCTGEYALQLCVSPTCVCALCSPQLYLAGGR